MTQEERALLVAVARALVAGKRATCSQIAAVERLVYKVAKGG